ADDFPEMTKYRKVLAYHNQIAADHFSWAGMHDDAEAAFRRALAVYDELAADADVIQDRAGMGLIQGSVGTMRRRAGRLDEALDWYARAIATLEGVLSEDQSNGTARRYLSNMLLWRSEVFSENRQHAEAAKDWERMVR